MKIGDIDKIIDSNWHYSWHWENENGYLTLKGLKQAKQDATGLLDFLKYRSEDIKRALEKIEAEIQMYKE